MFFFLKIVPEKDLFTIFAGPKKSPLTFVLSNFMHRSCHWDPDKQFFQVCSTCDKNSYITLAIKHPNPDYDKELLVPSA